jgi:DNA (cytosine-5)-methyltransferase 1
MSNISVGSVCSGIEAASVAWGDAGFDFKWFSEIAEFPSKLLRSKHPLVPNLGDLGELPAKLAAGQIFAPDLICGGTPCQAFSLAGWKKGLEDSRGNLTLKFVDIVEANDKVRALKGLPPSLVFWENVEGVLRDKTNAFGCLLASLAGYDREVAVSRWPQAGVIHGPTRNIAWRVLDAKYFGLAQQRRRLYVIAGGKDFFPENVLFETYLDVPSDKDKDVPLSFVKQGVKIEVFRRYADCLYSAYGTKWNGNAAAYNGSLFVLQNDRLRRFTPLECERLMGFPDNYTNILGASATSRYQGIGNSWAVPVVRWLGGRIHKKVEAPFKIDNTHTALLSCQINIDNNCTVFNLSKESIFLDDGRKLNCTEKPSNIIFGEISSVIDIHAAEKFYITPVGCMGILRRKEERQLSMNSRLESVFRKIASSWTVEKIDEVSRKQSRGRFSNDSVFTLKTEMPSYSLFDAE